MKEESHADGQASSSRERGSLESAARVEALRAVVNRHLRGDRRASDDIERLAMELASAARAAGDAPERLLITIRQLWRELGLAQADRLQAATLYEQLVRQAIEHYYGEDR